MVDAQIKALDFYINNLGFRVKHDIPVGKLRWLNLVSKEQPDGTELLLEPSAHPAAEPFKSALVADGIPFTSFQVDDLDSEYSRLRDIGVEFTQSPLEADDIKIDKITQERKIYV